MFPLKGDFAQSTSFPKTLILKGPLTAEEYSIWIQEWLELLQE